MFPDTQARNAHRTERFADRTFHHVVSFIEDTMFNEDISTREGLLQKIEPRVKILSLVFFVVVLSLQKSVEGIACFSLLVILLVAMSRVPFSYFLRKLLPAAVITATIAAPALLNMIVDGEPLFVLASFGKTMSFGPFTVPKEIAITRQGLASSITLLLRVLTSLSFVFLLIMTTPPKTFIKALTSLVPGPMKSVISINYRYLFFLVRKVEQFIMGLKSRQISTIESAMGRHWVASRIGLLFLTSMELSDELGLSMESRGYKGERFEIRSHKSKITGRDVGWIMFTIFFCGVIMWMFLR